MRRTLIPYSAYANSSHIIRVRGVSTSGCMLAGGGFLGTSSTQFQFLVSAPRAMLSAGNVSLGVWATRHTRQRSLGVSSPSRGPAAERDRLQCRAYGVDSPKARSLSTRLDLVSMLEEVNAASVRRAIYRYGASPR